VAEDTVLGIRHEFSHVKTVHDLPGFIVGDLSLPNLGAGPAGRYQ
jgi:hypothetical protein